MLKVDGKLSTNVIMSLVYWISDLIRNNMNNMEVGILEQLDLEGKKQMFIWLL